MEYKKYIIQLSYPTDLSTKQKSNHESQDPIWSKEHILRQGKWTLRRLSNGEMEMEYKSILGGSTKRRVLRQSCSLSELLVK